MFKPVLQEVTGNAGVPTQIIDVDTNTELAKQYSITAVPTIIVFQDGQQVHRSTGAMSKQQLQNILG
jgi:thioredoxin 1